MVMNCNPEIHNEMTTMEYLDCPFCDQQLQKPSITISDSCCDKPFVMNHNGTHISKSRGTVNGYQRAKEYIDFYENKYKIMKKSVYERESHLQDIINDICSKYRFHDQISRDLVFKEIDKIFPQINGNRKRMISINFVIKKAVSNVECST